MSAPFHIRRIRLINFHNFVDETLAVCKNVFLIGDNQSGKTTVLDAVHFALSAGVEMEFNAAARFGPRSEPGRTLASIVLRYDLERDAAQRPPSVMYAALEIEDEAGAVHTFGAGAFATSLDAQPDVWGFIARGKTLDEVGLHAEERDDVGAVRRRPRDRQELEERLGRGAVLDKGRYRTAAAQLLFRDRDAYLRGLELIAAGKAYRELVARARNLDDLFIGLLPPPAEAEFEEVRSALRAIEGIRSDLADLAAELDVLRRVIDKLHEARRETEKIARYQFVGAELERRKAAAAFEEARGIAQKAAEEATQADEARRTAEAEVGSREDALRALRASEGAALLSREEEARRDARARAFQWIDSSDGLRNERLWQKYAFRLEEQALEIRDQAGRPVEQVYEERETEVHSLESALDEKTRDLLERVVMAGLVRRLQGQVRELRETIQGINRLATDLRFGTSRFHSDRNFSACSTCCASSRFFSRYSGRSCAISSRRGSTISGRRARGKSRKFSITGDGSNTGFRSRAG